MGTDNAIHVKREKRLSGGVTLGTSQKTTKGKGPGHEEYSQIARSEKERKLSEDLERGRWAPDSYLKGWLEYTDESFRSESDIQQELRQDFHWSDEE